MDELLLAVLEFFFEVVVQVLFELAAEVIWRRKGTDAGSMLLLGIAGAVGGWISVLVFPRRLIGVRVAVPGLSLVAAPLATGFVMRAVGIWMRGRRWMASGLATFLGGAVFAFGMALV